MAVVGIDLGTTYSAIASVNMEGEASLIMNDDSELLTPSVVFFEDDNKIVVGRLAKNSSEAFPDQTIEFVKNHMGSGKIFTQMGNQYSPPHISAMILQKLIQDAEVHLKEKITDAVITVPAIFGDAQRHATKEAASIVGVNLIALLDEPEAAAINYGLTSAEGSKQTVMVYDLGGGTFDITILRINGRNFETLCTDGDRLLGGKLWDDKIIDHVADNFIKEHGSDPRANPEVKQKLRIAAEEAKRNLTKKQKTSIHCSHQGKIFRLELTREVFEAMTSSLLARTEMTMKLVIEEAINRGALKGWGDIDTILLVGGSSRMPQVAQMVRQVTGKDPKLFEPEQAVARGAALYATWKKNASMPSPISIPDPNGRISIRSVTSFSIGEVLVKEDWKPTAQNTHPTDEDNFNRVIIRKNEPLPARGETESYTLFENQTQVRIEILEGEDADPRRCIKLGDGIISGLPPLPKGTLVVTTVELTEEALIQITAKVPSVPNAEIRFEIRRTNSSDVGQARRSMRNTEVS